MLQVKYGINYATPLPTPIKILIKSLIWEFIYIYNKLNFIIKIINIIMELGTYFKIRRPHSLGKLVSDKKVQFFKYSLKI